MGGISGHVRILHRSLRADLHVGVHHDHRLCRLCRRSYGEHPGFIYRKNIFPVVGLIIRLVIIKMLNKAHIYTH